MNQVFNTFRAATMKEYDTASERDAAVMKASVEFRKQMLKRRWSALTDRDNNPHLREITAMFRTRDAAAWSAFIDARLREGMRRAMGRTVRSHAVKTKKNRKTK